VDMYRDLFPDEFEQETGGLDERLMSFYVKLSENLPMPDTDWIEENRFESEDADWFPEDIPFLSITPYESECVSEWESLSARVIYEIWWISGFREQPEAWTELEKKTKSTIPIPKELKTERWGQVVKRITALPGGARFLRAFKVISHNAGNFFVDNDDEMMCSANVPWKRDHVKDALKEIREAEVMFKDTRRICGRYDRHLQGFTRLLTKVIEIWNDGGTDAG